MHLRRVLVVSLLSLAGCGSPPPDPSGPSPEEVACNDYCKSAEALGCPKAGACKDGCMALFENSCSETLITLLDCMGPALGNDCVPRQPDGKTQACKSHLADYEECAPVDVGLDPATCASYAKSDDGKTCQGRLKCGSVEFGVDCDANGSCTCTRAGKTVGTCDNISSSAYFCTPNASCCTPFFKPQ
jgi:hypothetical protein